MISEYEKLLDMVTKLSPSVKEMSISLKRITPGLLAVGEKQAEKDVRKDGMPGRVIKRRFDKEETAGVGWSELADSTKVQRRLRGYNSDHPILVNTGHLEALAIDDINSYFTLDNRIALDVNRLGRIAGFLHNGTPNCPARPFYSSLEEAELEPIFAFTEGRIVIFVCAKVGLR